VAKRIVYEGRAEGKFCILKRYRFVGPKGKVSHPTADLVQGLMKKRTIIEAIKQVMASSSRPMTTIEVYEAIMRGGLYNFKADNPVHVVRSQIRRHCEGLDFESASPIKHFRLLPEGTYTLCGCEVESVTSALSSSVASASQPIDDLRRLHESYVADFRARVLAELRGLEPSMFERFCRNLLAAYGFAELVVTRVARDGGVDGHGRLKVGLVTFRVAFQCKRWTGGTVGRPEIDRFRGAIQGQYEQGMFFTTSTFTAEAQSVSRKPGAVPVVLVDGALIVAFMIDRGFGIERDALPLFQLALDLALE
jgi:restriction system protein